MGEIKRNFEIDEDGIIFIDGEEVGNVADGGSGDSKILSLIEQWKELDRLLQEKKDYYGSLLPHAWHSIKERETYVDLHIFFSHQHEPHTEKSLPPDREGWQIIHGGKSLSKEQRSWVKQKIKEMKGILARDGFEITPELWDSGDAHTDFGVKIAHLENIEEMIRRVIGLSLELGIDQYLRGGITG